MDRIPIIDISPLLPLDETNHTGFQPLDNPQIKLVVDQISEACRSYGFFAVTNHGVDPEVVSTAWSKSSEFFDMGHPIKMSVRMSPDYPYGYENFESLGTEQLDHDNKQTLRRMSTLPMDSKETFSIGPIDPNKSGMPSRRYAPNSPPMFERALTQYYDAMEQLARVLFQGFALALHPTNPFWFLQEGIFDEGHQSALRLLHYPEIEYEPIDPEQVQIRAGAHTDYGAMTILKSGGPGLQLCLSPGSEEDSSWIDVPHLPDGFIVNLGDLMQRWTNDTWKSTLHRVVAVADDKDCHANDDIITIRSAERQSMAFFVNINRDASVSPIDTCVTADRPSRYDPIKAGEHLIQRHMQSLGIRAYQ